MLPLCYIQVLADVIGDANAVKVGNVWYQYSQLQLSSATREDLIQEAKTILSFL